jgi:hypothetical protein
MRQLSLRQVRLCMLEPEYIKRGCLSKDSPVAFYRLCKYGNDTVFECQRYSICALRTSMRARVSWV